MGKARAGILLAASVYMFSASPAAATMDAIFSPTFNQYGTTAQGGITLIQHRVYHSDTVIDDSILPFVPASTGLDAIDMLRGGAILFSVDGPGAAYHAGGLIYLKEDVVYRFDPATGIIGVEVDWASYGINLGSLDALDRITEQLYAFSIETYRMIQHSGGTLMIHPQNVYVFNRDTGTVALLFDGVALGLVDLDAVDIFADGRVGFSTATNTWIAYGGVGRHLKPQDVYVLDGSKITVALDGDSRGVQSVDAVHLTDTDVQVDVELDVDGDRIVVNSFYGAAGYDVVTGDLGLLHSSGGDYSVATTRCLVKNGVGPEWSCDCSPEPGEGVWILVRVNVEDATFDSGGRHQVAGRDAGIAAAGLVCP